MATFLDTSALLRRYLRDRDSGLVDDAMNADDEWIASALARTETQLALRRVARSSTHLDVLWATFIADWDAFAVVPVDDRCLAESVELGTRFGLRTVDAIHLAAAARLPPPVRFVSLSRQQLPAAASLGLDVVSPVEP